MDRSDRIAEANTRVDDYIARAIKALPSQATLKLTLQELHGDCSDPTDNGPKNRVVANRSYEVLGLAQQHSATRTPQTSPPHRASRPRQ